jgi:hypothetical protein
MASAGRLAIHVKTRVSVTGPEVRLSPMEWHDDSWRCRIAARVYAVAWRLSRLADRIDTVSDHPKEIP